MAIKIAVPKGKYIENLISNLVETSRVYGVELIYSKENDIPNLFLSKSIDLALMNPLNYGKLVETEPFHIIPTTCVAANGFSRLATIVFEENLIELKKIAVPEKESFLAIATKIIYDEKYDFSIKLIEQTLDKPNNANDYDAALSFEKDIEKTGTMDLTEEWTDNFEFAMPLAFWVMSEKADAEQMKKITNSLIKKDLANPEVIFEHYHSGALSYERQGEIHWNFYPEFEKVIDDTLELLYQLNYLKLLSDSHIVE